MDISRQGAGRHDSIPWGVPGLGQAQSGSVLRWDAAVVGQSQK